MHTPTQIGHNRLMFKHKEEFLWKSLSPQCFPLSVFSCPMWLLKASVEAAVVPCQAVSRSCLQDLLPERRQWQGPDWWCGKQMSGESASFSCSGCGGWRDGSGEINLKGGLRLWMYIYKYQKSLDNKRVRRQREGFCWDQGFILIWKSPLFWGFVSYRSSNNRPSETAETGTMTTAAMEGS